MFARFSPRKHRIDVAVVHNEKVGGKVRQHFIAAFGSVPHEPDAADRAAFWERAIERLTDASDRINADQRASILRTLNARIPMPHRMAKQHTAG